METLIREIKKHSKALERDLTQQEIIGVIEAMNHPEPSDVKKMAEDFLAPYHNYKLEGGTVISFAELKGTPQEVKTNYDLEVDLLVKFFNHIKHLYPGNQLRMDNNTLFKDFLSWNASGIWQADQVFDWFNEHVPLSLGWLKWMNHIPTEEKSYLISTSHDNVLEAVYRKGKFGGGFWDKELLTCYSVKYWMPLPQAKK